MCHLTFTARLGTSRIVHRYGGRVSPMVATELIEHPDRVVTFDASHNFRDMGGYPLGDGRVTSWRRLYRADGLQRLTDADHDRLGQLGLRTVVDLRTFEELDERGKLSVERHDDLTFVHLPIVDSTWRDAGVPEFDADADFLRWAYREMLRQGSSRFADGIRLLAEPDTLPAVFHCAAGKDRTGLLAALILGSIGVSRALILADYALTADGMVRLIAWARTEFPDMAHAPSAFLAALPEALDTVLDEVCAEHGSIRAYVLSLGVTEAELAALADALTS
jgi:protein-tyrosine phosphatase